MGIAELLAKSDEETWDYVRDFGSHSGSCWLGRAFSSDYTAFSLCNSAVKLPLWISN